MTANVWLNGEFVAEIDATVSVSDGGWLHGAGLFETMRAEGGRVFRLESHLARLLRSAAKLLAPIRGEILPSAVDFETLLERNDLKTARVRLTVSAGAIRTEEPEAGPHPTICATAAALSPPATKLYERGVHVLISDHRQSPADPLAGHKTTAYLSRLFALRTAQRLKCAEALWFTTGNQLAEGCITNVFIVKDGILETPPLDTPVLPGIARGVVLGIARQADIEVRECSLTIDDLLDADEVFLTNAIMQVMPATRVEKHDIAQGKVGPIAKQLLESYRQLVREECGGK